MPVTRRTSSRTDSAKGQSTLGFHTRITKNVQKDSKKRAISPIAANVVADIEAKGGDSINESISSAQNALLTDTPAKSSSDIEAENVSAAEIARYWTSIEKQRIAPRVHQEDLDISEKVLRYFDLSAQYGPCIGTSRLKRWRRAERLGLHPPVEILAVLLQDEQSTKKQSFSHMDEIMNSRAAGAGL